MLSVCIPVYNHSFLSLAKALHTQCETLDFPYEIIVSDDCSDLPIVTSDAKAFALLDNVVYKKNKTNLGNDLNRNQLAEMAQYPWLLFLDADTMPIDADFISNYIRILDEKPADVYSGGIVYGALENPAYILKWKHGKKAEEVTQNIKEDDYLGFRGNNFLIKKEVFLKTPFIRMSQKYGYIDTVFGINLKLNGYTLKLIHNPVEHLGLMDGKTFINKTKKAVENALFLESNHPRIADKIKLIRFYRSFKKLCLTSVIAKLYRKFEPTLYSNLVSSDPSLLYFQLYKLGYICWLEQQSPKG